MICNPCEVSTIKPMPINITPEIIVDRVCKFYNTPVERVRSKTRKQEITTVRQVCMFVLREKTDLILKDIGLMFGNRDHTTVLHSCQTITNEMDTNEAIRTDVEYLLNNIDAYKELILKPVMIKKDKRRYVKKSFPQPVVKIKRSWCFERVKNFSNDKPTIIRPAAVYSNHSYYGIASSY